MSENSFIYHIDEHLISPATRVIFTRHEKTKQRICLKLWRSCDDGLYDTTNLTKATRYTLEGLAFNRRCAPDVYLGIARVESIDEENKIIELGELIKYPEENELNLEARYALVMKHMPEEWLLSQQLDSGQLATTEDMEFLAREVTLMHQLLIISKEGFGRASSISSKLLLNIQKFDQILNRLLDSDEHIENYRWISDTLAQACEEYIEYFDRRYENGHVGRCHGDLKTTNLWILPERSHLWGAIKFPRQLVALDCVDFNPEFCHIDTLSDIAMLAVDIEMHLNKVSDEHTGNNLVRHFLNFYLQYVGEDRDEVWPLLEYYMTEKAVICAYISVLYDNSPALGGEYLNVAIVHAQELKRTSHVRK